MTQGKQNQRRLRRFRRIIAIFGTVILLLLFGESIWLGSKILQRLEELSIAQTDNFQWNITQIEVEHLKVEKEALRVESANDLNEMRRAFDVFYSRIVTVRESSVFAPLRQNGNALEVLLRIQARLDEMAVYVDASDVQLMGSLDSFRALLADNRTDTRALALTAIDTNAAQNAAKRHDLHRLLSQMAAVVFVLVTALGMTALLLSVLYRRGRQLAHINESTAARMRAMVTSSLDAILVMDSSGYIVEYNGAAESVFGYSRDEAMGVDMAQLIVPTHHRKAHKAGLERFLSTGIAKASANGRIELEGLRKSGEVFPVELSITPTYADDETVFVSFLRDISDRYAVEAELRAARDDALAGERAKANLLTVMSHEMRTPLTGVLGAIDIMEAEEPTRQQQKYLRAMRVSGELLLQHVNDVLELSRLESDTSPEETSTFDLVDLVDGLVTSQQAAASANGNELTVHCNLGLVPTVEGRSRAIQQALLNLVGNAIKFTRNGAIMVDVVRIDGGDIVEFQVADTGKGIAPGHLDRIFEDFVTLDTSYGRMSEGTGLGLAITRRMVAGMGGEISCDSELGEGSSFVFRIPLPMAEISQPAHSAPQSQVQGPVRLMVVEDNDVNRELLKRMLEMMGHQVVAASGGGEAINFASENEFDLILMDISMPDIDGIEAIQRIRMRGLAPGIDIVALTAHAAADDHRRILEAGFAEILTKPVDKPKLQEVISRRAKVSNSQDEGEGDSSDLAQFFELLGNEKAQEFLMRFLDEIADFAGEIGGGVEIGSDLRAEAHRLAGSAAVLGMPGLRVCLQQIEMDNAPRPEACDDFGRVWQETETVLAHDLGQIAAE